MRKNALVTCCITFVFAAFGAFFRWLQNMTAFESDTGLYIHGNLWGRAIILCCLLLAALMFWLVRKQYKQGFTLPKEPEVALAGNTIFYKPLSLLLPAIMALGSLMLIFSASEDKYPLFQLVLAVFGIFGGIGFLLLSSSTYSKRRPPLNCFGATLLVCLYFVWLIGSYRANAATPVVWRYAIEVLALSCTLVAFYYIAGIPFGRARPARVIYSTQLAAFLCAVTLPDERHMGQQVMLFATICMLIFFSCIVMSALREEGEDEAAAEAPQE